jgi:hypothetical protein
VALLRAVIPTAVAHYHHITTEDTEVDQDGTGLLKTAHLPDDPDRARHRRGDMRDANGRAGMVVVVVVQGAVVVVDAGEAILGAGVRHLVDRDLEVEAILLEAIVVHHRHEELVEVDEETARREEEAEAAGGVQVIVNQEVEVGVGIGADEDSIKKTLI